MQSCSSSQAFCYCMLGEMRPLDSHKRSCIAIWKISPSRSPTLLHPCIQQVASWLFCFRNPKSPQRHRPHEAFSSGQSEKARMRTESREDQDKDKRNTMWQMASMLRKRRGREQGANVEQES